ncbi:MAG TPA: HEAT repeat domain-containing protein [Cellulomonas sp.]
MSARQRYADELARLDDGEIPAYLTAGSGLPGPRSNLELLYAFGDVAPARLVLLLADHADEYLRCCGTAALGRLLLEADDEAAGASSGAADLPTRAALEAVLTERARDPMWRVREGAAMAGQRLGAAAPEALAGLVGRWLDPRDPLVARAAVAAICEPPILRPSPLLRAAALDACERATDVLRAVPPGHRRDADVRTLRQGLAYCWSVAVAADPGAGLPRFRALQADDDPDVAWLARENAKKARLAALL